MNGSDSQLMVCRTSRVDAPPEAVARRGASSLHASERAMAGASVPLHSVCSSTGGSCFALSASNSNGSILLA